ncbi:Fic family protein [Desulfitispora alkaliphila]|uniref:Fic family protein n=1 Tax=Desulfitispora alkaliphila TaxID=622674 RepID=UPI003D25DADF
MENRAGRKIKSGGGKSEYYCFVPAPLPPQNPPIQYDDELIYLISEANRFIGRLDEVTDNLISPSYFVYMYARKEATLSSQIEGTRATFSDLIKAEAGMMDEVPNDVREIENYIRATNYGFERLSTLPISLRLIREIHAILMEGVRGENKTPGEFRKSQNWIGGYSISTASYIPPSVDYLDDCLDNFEKFMHQDDRMSLLVKAALLHSQFEMVHPFLDGNGRVGRLLIAFYLAEKDILHKPTLYISKFIKRNQQAYYDCLYNIHAKGEYETWLKFFLTGVIETAQEAVKIARQITALRDDDLRKINSMGRTSKNAMIIYEGLFDKPTISIEEVTTKLDTSVATGGRLLERLCEEGILSKLNERKRNKVFVYRRYIDIFNKD